MNKKNKFGKVVKDVKGYKIRIMTKSTSIKKTDRKGAFMGYETIYTDAGTFGVYAGKKLIKNGYKNLNEAIACAESL